MNAVKLLKDDHKKVKDLFRQFESAGEKAYQRKQQIAEKVFLELEVHSKIEEEIFYPAVRAQPDKEGQEVVRESIEEHHVVDVLINELRGMDPKDERYDAKFTVLTENVEHHIEEEEKEMLPEAEKLLKDDLAGLGQQMEERKRHLMAIMA